MNDELLEYLKFLHLHNLIDIVTIIDSIPIYYHTQIKESKPVDESNVIHQKMRLQNLTYIAHNGFNLSFPSFKFQFQTVRLGPYSHDIENELQNLINSTIFNNAVSSPSKLSKRYIINSYDKSAIMNMFRGSENYHRFLNTVDNCDIFSLRDIAHTISFHNHFANGSTSRIARLYKENDIYKYKILHQSLTGIVTFKKDYNGYIKNLIDLVLSLQKSQNSQNLFF